LGSALSRRPRDVDRIEESDQAPVCVCVLDCMLVVSVVTPWFHDPPSFRTEEPRKLVAGVSIGLDGLDPCDPESETLWYLLSVVDALRDAPCDNIYELALFASVLPS
jgi:hypothetical protein